MAQWANPYPRQQEFPGRDLASDRVMKIFQETAWN